MPSVRETLQRNLQRVEEQIQQAANLAGRPRDEMKLVATTKYVDAPVVRELIAAGHRLLGESRPQDLWTKSAELAGFEIEWHLIGHLQRNKIRRTLPLVTLIHSVDSARLLAALNAEASLLGRPVSVLLEVNISGDESKHGFDPGELDELLAAAGDWPLVQIHGLMGMASLEGGAAQARRDFAALRSLRDRLRPIAPQSANLRELSMGMSGDFAEAIQEGATLVRIGSALFKGIRG
jgi:pyridoxal phosphate enzyme (YggS family)